MDLIKFDPDFAMRMQELGPRPRLPKITTPLEYRARSEAFIGSLLSFPFPKNVIETKHTIASFDGAEIDVYRFLREDKANPAVPLPALVYAHGGGIVAAPIKTIIRPGIAQLVAEDGVQAFAVEYRMAPEHPYPTPVEDFYAALKWVIDHAEELSVDPTRVAVIGESGGACLAAGAAFFARDRGLQPPIAKQILVYPMLDDMSPGKVNIDSPRGQYLSDYVNYIQICWEAYLGVDRAGKAEADVPYYASPARADNVHGLPPTYIDVGSLDLFRDESLAFAGKLAAANVDVELHLYHGVPHCFDLIAPNVPVSKNAKDNRSRAICSF